MPQALTQNDVNLLESFRDNGQVADYWGFLASKEYLYANLALDVFQGTQGAGNVARLFAQNVGAITGTNPDLSGNEWAEISQGLMSADFNLRQAMFDNGNSVVELSGQQIEDYHTVVFQGANLPPDAWTAFAPLNIGNPDAATKEARWDAMVSFFNGGGWQAVASWTQANLVPGYVYANDFVSGLAGLSGDAYHAVLWDWAFFAGSDFSGGAIKGFFSSGDIEPYVIQAPDGDWVIGGSNEDNILIQGASDDAIMIGYDGNDTLYGNSGKDVLYGGKGSDTLHGYEGDDILIGHETRFVPGSDKDFAAYTNATAGIVVDMTLTEKQVSDDGMGGQDTLFSIEGIIGSDYNDSIKGDDQDNDLRGGKGDDTIIGGYGTDSFDGGEGEDTLNYAELDAPIFINLPSQSIYVNGVFSTVQNVERFIGTDQNDGFEGDDNANYFDGGKGDDSLTGGAGDDTLDGGSGLNTLDGGEGVDTVDYSARESGVVLQINGYSSAGDTLLSIENLILTEYNDVVIGDGSANVFDGRGGNDVFYGQDGDDTLLGGEGNDRLRGQAGADLLEGGKGNDTLSAYDAPSLIPTLDRLYGGEGNDVLYGSMASPNQLFGGDGDDHLYLSNPFPLKLLPEVTLYGGNGIDSYHVPFFPEQNIFSQSRVGIIDSDAEFEIVQDGRSYTNMYVESYSGYGVPDFFIFEVADGETDFLYYWEDPSPGYEPGYYLTTVWETHAIRIGNIGEFLTVANVSLVNGNIRISGVPQDPNWGAENSSGFTYDI